MQIKFFLYIYRLFSVQNRMYDGVYTLIEVMNVENALP